MFKLFQIRVVKLNIFISSLWIPLRQHVLDTVLCDKACVRCVFTWGLKISLNRYQGQKNIIIYHRTTTSTSVMSCVHLKLYLYNHSLKYRQSLNPAQATCTWYSIMWQSLSVTCGRWVVFSEYSGFLHQ
jgi:hypothetical protein